MSAPTDHGRPSVPVGARGRVSRNGPRLRVAARIARRELRGGLAGFRVFLACLALGVAAIAAVGTVREAIERGLEREGAVILGGDASVELTYRFADEPTLAWFDRVALEVSEITDFRSMVVVDRDGEAERALTQVKSVDDAYPLLGEVRLAPAMPLAEVFETRDGVPGAAMDPVLVERLGLELGEIFRMGIKDFRLAAVIEREPDAGAEAFGLGPRTLVRTADLAGSGLLQPGTLFESEYRLRLPPEADLDVLRGEMRATLGPDARWRDRRNGSGSIDDFVERLGAFLVLTGLAGLAVGGVGIAAAVRAYLAEKTATIATLRTLGADRRTVFATYALQIGAVACLGIAIGLVLGVGVPLLLAPLIEARLPVPAAFGVYPRPVGEAALYGALAAAIFTLWPLARTEAVRPASLYRDFGDKARPRTVWLVTLAVLLAVLIASAALFSDLVGLTLWSAAGFAGAFAVLMLAAEGVRRLARRLARSRLLRGRTTPRLALGAVGGPGGEATSVVLSLGLGLAVLAAVGQIDANLRMAIAEDLPEVAPTFFVVDIQPDQVEGVLARLESDPGVSRIETAPMLRGVVTEINGRPAREVAGSHWVLRGDRGVTYSAIPPEDATVTAGAWWPADYDGPPQVSFAAEEGAELGLTLGDEITVDILGRPITAEITSFREVDFSTAGIGFILSMNPAALEGAPHSFIATIYAAPEAEAAILRDIGDAYPNVTLIRIGEAIERASEVLAGIAAAVTWGALATLLTGGIVLMGAAAAGERARTYEAAVLKTLGASRAAILTNFALRSTLLGAAAGIVAIVAGGLAGWGVMRFVMDLTYRFEPVSAVVIVLGGVVATLLTGLAFAWRPLATSPARVLRARE